MNLATHDTESCCHDCGSTDLRIAKGFEQVRRVTSDCYPWSAGGILALCRSCGLVQTITNARWHADAAEIYRRYNLYHQSGGVEQAVFDAATGNTRLRSEAIIKRLSEQLPLPVTGSWLDVGCGMGTTLRACSRLLPSWTLFGSDLSDKHRGEIEGIRGVKRMFTGPIAEISESFDVISLSHVIEHVPGPRAFLRRLAERLRPGGLLLLEVPDCRKNFFTLAVADHCSHFSARMLGEVARGAGYEVLVATDTWVPKEVTVVARQPANLPASASATSPPILPSPEAEQVFDGWHMLERIALRLDPLLAAGQFGILGTSIAGTWMDAQTGGLASFFVDEDPSRVGRLFFGRPVVRLAEVPQGAGVYVALPPETARGVAERLRIACPTAQVYAPEDAR